MSKIRNGVMSFVGGHHPLVGWLAKSGLGIIFTLPLSIAVGTFGGYAFYNMHLPLPWLLGSIMSSMLAVLFRLPITMVQPLWVLANIVLSLLLGSRVAPEYFNDMLQWVESITGLLLCLGCSTILVYIYLRIVGRYDAVTSFFGATPGGIVEMTQIGSELGGDARTLSLLHSCRLFLVVAFAPVLLFMFGADDLFDAGRVMSGDEFPGAIDLAIMVLSTLSGIIVARFLRLPGTYLVGPLIVYGTASALGIADSAPPNDLVIVAQIICGTGLGARFRGIPYGFLGRTMAVALGSTAIHLNFSLLFAVLVHLISGLSIGRLILAYAPGGQVEMSLLALSMGTDAAFITAHTMIRAFVIVLLAPLIFRVFAFLLPEAKPSKESLSVAAEQEV